MIMANFFRDRKQTSRSLTPVKQNKPTHSVSQYCADSPPYPNRVSRNRMTRAPMVVGGAATAQMSASYPSSASGSQRGSQREVGLATLSSCSALALSVSVAALSLSLASGAQAQNTIPAECTPTSLVAGGTLTCVSATPITESILTTVDGVTIIIGNSDTPTAVETTSGDSVNASIAGDGTGDININSEHGTISSDRYGIFADNRGTGSIRITTADVTGRGSPASVSIRAQITNSAATGALMIDTSGGSISGDAFGIHTRNTGSGVTIITTASVSGGAGTGILAETVGGAIITVNVGGTVSGTSAAIETNAPGGSSATPADGVIIRGTVTGNISTFSGDDAVILADTSTTTGITINLGEGNDRLTLASVNFGTLDGGTDTDTLNISATGITLDAATVSGFETFAFAQGSHTLSGTHTGLTSSTIATGAMLDLAADSSLDGNLSNSGMLTVAGSGIGTATIIGSLTLNASGTLSLNTLADGSFDQIIVNGMVSVGGALALGQQTTMPDGTVVLIDAGSLSGTFATTTGLIDTPLISQTIAYDSGTGQVRLVTSVMTPVPLPDSSFPTSCTVMPMSPLAAGGTLTCVSATPITETIATTVDGITIIIGNSDTPTTVETTSGGAINARIAGDGTGDININSEYGTLSGGRNGIFASNAGTGGISITTGSVTGRGSSEGSGIYAQISNNGATSNIMINSSGGISTGYAGIFARNTGTGGIEIITAAVTSSGYYGIFGNIKNSDATGDISITASGAITGASSSSIRAINEGTGGISITTADLIGRGGATIGTGIIAMLINSAATGDIMINSSGGSITEERDGIVVRNTGTGGISITTADVTSISGTGTGISAMLTSNTATGALMIDSSRGSVTGGREGISVENAGTGGISITTANVTSSGDISTGISARLTNMTATGDIMIDSSGGSVTGGREGINVFNTGTGGISITTADVTSSGDISTGISARLTNSTATGDIMIDSSGGSVTGTGQSINASNSGTGGISITTANVTSSGDISIGISARLTNMTASGAVMIDSSGGSVTGGREGINVFNTGTGDVTISGGSVTGGTVGIRAITVGGGNILISGAHTVSGNISGIIAESNGGDISIQGVGATNGVTSTAGNGISANATTSDGAGGNINIGGMTALGAVTSTAGNGIYAQTDGTDSTITIDASDGAVMGGMNGIRIRNGATGASAISITTADVTGTGQRGINAFLNNSSGTSDISITANGAVMGGRDGIFVRNDTTGAGGISITTADVTGTDQRGINAFLYAPDGTGDLNITTNGTVIGSTVGIYTFNDSSGATNITVSSVSASSGYVSASAGIGIFTRTRDGANIIVNAGSTVSGAAMEGAIRTDSSDPSSMTVTPADSITIMGTVTAPIRTLTGDDRVTLAAESTTTSIIDLGEGDDTLDLASTTFGTFDGGENTDTLHISGTGITLDGGAHANFETLTFAQGSNTLSGTHTGLMSSSIATGAMLDLAAGSSLSGDLSNSGMLTVAGDGIGTATISGGLTLNASGTVSLNTLTDGSFDQIIVGGVVSIDGTLALGQQTKMSEGNIVLIDGGAALSGTFASTTGLIMGLLIRQAIAYDTTTGEVRLVTIVMDPSVDLAFPVGCTVAPVSPLADGGTLTCVSRSPIAEPIATTVDGVTIIIGESGTMTTVMTDSGDDALSASITDTSAAGDIIINSEFGIITGGARGIVATTAGSGSITITGGSVTGQAGDGISATTAGGAISISGVHTVLGTGGHGIFADSDGGDSGGGDISIQGVGTTGGVTGTAGHGIYADARNGEPTLDIGGTIAIGNQNPIGNITGSNHGIYASTNGQDRRIMIAASSSAIRGGASGIVAHAVGGGINIYGAHTISGGIHGIEAISGGGYIRIRRVGLGVEGDDSTGGITGSAGHGIFADARGGTRGNINIGDIDGSAIGAVTGTGSEHDGIFAQTDGPDRITMIDISGAVIGGRYGIQAINDASGASMISITTAAVTGMRSDGISAKLDNSGATGSLTITAGGAVIGGRYGIYARQDGSGTVTIDASTAGAIGGTGEDAAGIRVISAGTGAISVMNVGRGGIASRAISIVSTGAVSGAASGISATHTGGGAVSITSSNSVIGQAGRGISAESHGGAVSITSSNTVTGQVGSGINAISRGGAISISGAHDVRGNNGAGIFADSDGGDISIQGGGVSGRVQGTGRNIGHGIFADARGGSGGNINIGDSVLFGAISGNNFNSYGVLARTDGTNSSITIDTSGGTATHSTTAGISVISARNNANGASNITITTASVSSPRFGGSGIRADLAGSNLTGDINITANGLISIYGTGISASNFGSGTTNITASSITSRYGYAINVRTTAGANIIVKAGSTITSGTGRSDMRRRAAIRTDAISDGRRFTPADSVTIMGTVSGNILTLSGADTVTLADTSVTTGIIIDLGGGNDTLNLAVTSFGTLNASSGEDRLRITDTDVTLAIIEAGVMSGEIVNFETLVFATEDEYRLTGSFTGFSNNIIDAGARLNLESDSVFIGDLSNSGMLTVAGSGFGSATITGDLVLDSSGTLILDVSGMGNANDLLRVIGAVTLGGTLALRQTTIPDGTVILIDGGTALSGGFANSNELRAEGLVNGLLINQRLVLDMDGFNLQLVTTSMLPVPLVDPEFPTGCLVEPLSPLIDGGMLTCISATPIRESLATSVDGVTIIIGDSSTRTSVITDSGDAISASIAGTSAAGDISINSVEGIISGGTRGIVATTAGSGSITITGGSVTGNAGDAISASITGTSSAGDISINSVEGIISGGTRGIFATTAGSGSITIIGGSVTGNAGDAIRATTAGGDISIRDMHTVLGTGGRGIVASTVGSGSITITGGSVTGNAGDAIRATTAGGDISISGTHTVLGTGGRGISVDSHGGDISIRGVGLIGGIGGTAGHGIFADATGGTRGNIDIGGSGENAIGSITGRGITNRGIYARTSGTDSTVTIDTSGGRVEGDGAGIAVRNPGSGANSISITTAAVTGGTSDGIDVQLSGGGATGDISVTTTGLVTGGSSGAGIAVRHFGTGTTSITVDSVSAPRGVGILTRTRTGASITVNARATLSGSSISIQTDSPSRSSSATPADSVTILGTVSGGNIETWTGDDTVTLAAGSTTSDITIDLGEGADTLNLASANFAALDGGKDTDTLRISGTGITLDGSAHSGFETITATAGSNILSGTHSGLTASSIATGATLDLAAGSSLSGDLANSGTLEVAGSATGAATVIGSLTLNADGTLRLDTTGMSNNNDFLTVQGAVTLGGILALQQSEVVPGTIILIDSATSLSGDFIAVTGLRDSALISQSLFRDPDSFNLQLVTVVVTPDPNTQTHTGCVVVGGEPLVAGGILNCISAEELTSTILINVDGVTINVGDAGTPTTINVASDGDVGTSDDAIRALVGLDGTAGITIDSSNGTLIGADNGIHVYSAGTGTISIIADAVTGVANDAIYAGLGNGAGDAAITITTIGAVEGGTSGIRATNVSGGASSITINAAAVVTGTANDGISVGLASAAATGDISITTTGMVSGGISGISALNAGSGTTTITTASVTSTSGIGIRTRTTAGANIIITTGSTVSGGVSAIQTDVLDGDSSSTPADSVTIRGTVTGGNILTLAGADTVTLADTSTTTSITIDLGAGDDSLDLASTAFGRLDGGPDTDTLSVSGTGINLDGGAHSNFETLIFAAGSNTLSGTHTGLASSSIATGAMLDLAAGSSLTGDLSNSGMLTVAGSGFGSATIIGDLVLNAGGTVSLDTNGAGSETDLLTVTGAVTLGGTLALTQTIMPDGTVVLIDGGAALTGTFAEGITGLINAPLIRQVIAYDTTTGEVRLVTTVLEFDPAFPTGCTVAPVSPLADGGTLTCISAAPITETITTSVDGVTIIIGDSSTPTTVMTSSGNAIYASIAGDSAAGSITINSEFGIISGRENGIYARNAGTGGISITTADVTSTSEISRGINAQIANMSATGDIMIDSSGGTVTVSTEDFSGIRARHAGTGGISITTAAVRGSGTNADGIIATLDNSNAAGSLSITATGAVSGGRHGISAQQNGSGTLTIDARTAGAIGGTGEGDVGILATSTGSGAITVRNTGSGGPRSRAISIVSSGAISGAAGGIAATHTGDGAITISGTSVTGNAGSGISTTTAGGAITISGAHTVLGIGGHGIYADSDGGDISIQGVGATGGVSGTAGHGIVVDARGSSGGNINIGDITPLGAISGIGSRSSGIFARTNRANRSITIDSTGGAVMGSRQGIFVSNTGTGASSISITSADVTAMAPNTAAIDVTLHSDATGAITIDSRLGTVSGGAGIFTRNDGTGDVTIMSADVTATYFRSAGISANISNSNSAGSIVVDSSDGTVSGRSYGISVTNAGSGTTSITVGDGTKGSVSASSGRSIFARTTTGASIIVNAGGTVSGGGGTNAIQTDSPESDTTSTPADSITILGTVSSGNISTLAGADTVTLADTSVTNGITVDLGAGDDRLDLASVNFGRLAGGDNTDTLTLSGTGINLGGGAHSGFETLILAAGSNTLSGTHTGLTSSRIETGAMLDLAARSSLSGDLANSGILTVDGSDFGSSTITGDLVLNAGGTLILDTNGAGRGNDFLIVTGAVTLGGTLVLRQTTMPDGMVILIDGRTGISGSFASSNELSTEGLVDGVLITQTLVLDEINFNLQLVTTVRIPEPVIDSAFPTGCTVTPFSPLVAGGTLTCISAVDITSPIATSVDGVTIIIGESATPTIIRTTSGDAISASIAGDSAAGNIRINGEFSIISGAENGIVATTAGSGSITITGGSVTGNAGDAISATTAGGDIMISGVHIVLGLGGRGIFADSDGGDISISDVRSVSGTGGRGISAISGGGDISVQGVGAGATDGVQGSAGHGIYADARGGSGGTINIGGMTEFGAITGSGTGNIGVFARTDGTDSSITIDSSSGTVTGVNHGIRAENAGTGGISITTAAAAAGTGANDDGIYASLSNSAATGDLSIIATGAVSGGRHGIYAQQNGSGTLRIDASIAGAIGGTDGGDVGILATSTGSGAITVRNAGSGGPRSRAISIISTGAVSGAVGGIAATHTGDGAITISGTSVTGNAGSGISATTVGGAITISGAHTVLGTGGRGIESISGGGDISIQGLGATGGIEGTAGHGIFADARGGSGGTINIGDITALGDVTGTGTGNSGIIAQTGGTGSSITIDASGAVRGNRRGIAATTAGGAITISGTSVTGNAGSGISATTAGGAITISGAHTVLGTGGRGIESISGGGDISIQGLGATGGIEGTAGHGIFADARGGSGGTINIGGITALGDVTGTGTGNSGIFAQTDGTGSSITIDASGAVRGTGGGIAATTARRRHRQLVELYHGGRRH